MNILEGNKIRITNDQCFACALCGTKYTFIEDRAGCELKCANRVKRNSIPALTNSLGAFFKDYFDTQLVQVTMLSIAITFGGDKKTYDISIEVVK